MKHNDFKKYLGGAVWEAMEEEIATHTRFQMIYVKQNQPLDKLRNEVIDNLDWRWSQPTPAIPVTDRGRQVQRLLRGILLHKFGWATQTTSARAVAAARELALSMSEGFERAIPSLEELLATANSLPSRAPSYKVRVTQYREGDLLAIAHDQRFYCAYVLSIPSDRGGDFEQLEFYDAVFDDLPAAERMTNLPARALTRGSIRMREPCYLCGLHGRPDPSGQIAVLASNWRSPPRFDDLQPGLGGGPLTPLHRLRDFINGLFSTP
ncbi:hypothetical protein [Lysobacter sp. FW306-1B-D06B]|uniref:hypothetical protein n=1 Tax=Lysobacter sp. FW306-1B-D06B TaxID=3140250 RepID=UPI0031409BAD